MDGFSLILQAIKSGDYQMMISNVHFEEVNAIKDFQERHEILILLNRYGVQCTNEPSKVEARAEELLCKEFWDC